MRKTAMALCTATLVATFAGSANAQVDPFTAVQVIAGVIGAINAISSSNAQAEWNAQATGKLDVIISQNDAIIGALQNLSLDIPAELQTEFNQEEGLRAITLSRQFDLYMHDLALNKSLIVGMRQSAENTALNLEGRGPSVYQAEDAAAVLVLAIYKVIGTVPQTDKDSFLNGTISTMQTWAGNAPGNFGDAINKQQSALNSAEGGLHAIPQGPQVVIYSEPVSFPIEGVKHGGEGHCILKLNANVSVDEVNLAQRVVILGSSGCADGSQFNPDVVAQKQAAYASQIQGFLNTIGAARKNLATLQSYESALQAMIVSLQNQL
jgi:hypothetical protein